jgi:phosphate transport system substrate-binding protein
VFRSRRGTVLAIGVLSTVLFAACSSGNDNPSGGGTSSGGATSGSVVVSGSSTVQPITSLVAEKFSGTNPDVSVKVDGPGTTDGFVLFCKGETDINDASRPIAPEEVKACKSAGVHYQELEIGLDGITVMTNPANTAVKCLNKGDLYALLGPESQGFKNWSDADQLASEVGGTGNFPNSPLDITAPGQESGTYDAFIELALADIIEQRKQDSVLRPDYQSSPNDNVIIQAMQGSDTPLGFVGFAFADQNSDTIKEIAVDGGDGCVLPSHDTIADGSYPLSRSLYVYVNTDKASSNAALKSFVDFYMTPDGFASVTEADYVALPAERVAATKKAWADAGV